VAVPVRLHLRDLPGRGGLTGPSTRARTSGGARFSLALAISVVCALAILCGLGTWQLQRLAWKEDILARIAALKDAPPEPAEVVLKRIGDGLSADYLRVELDCPALETLPTVRLYALKDGRIGDRLIAACPVDAAPYRSLLVDRGFLADGQAAAPGRPLTTHVVGVLRQGDKPSPFTPKRDPAGGRWFGRDVPAMAAALKATYPAPLFLMLESPAPAGPPAPSPLPADIPNRHLEYALTWFGLALTLLAVYIAKLVRDRKA
jgi:surfeit locus 1 family protein